MHHCHLFLYFKSESHKIWVIQFELTPFSFLENFILTQTFDWCNEFFMLWDSLSCNSVQVIAVFLFTIITIGLQQNITVYIF